MNYQQALLRMGSSRWYWLGLLVIGLAMEGLALLYQYQWDYEPCVLCIHVRLWLLGLITLALLALLLPQWRFIRPLMHGLSALLMGGLLERSYQLLATERGWIFGSCDMDAGLPPWFALDSWFPAVFGVQTSCGYTPELLFGITMAEGLLLFSALLLTTSLLLLLVGLRDIVR